jgi:hypothetical protein
MGEREKGGARAPKANDSEAGRSGVLKKRRAITKRIRTVVKHDAASHEGSTPPWQQHDPGHAPGLLWTNFPFEAGRLAMRSQCETAIIPPRRQHSMLQVSWRAANAGIISQPASIAITEMEVNRRTVFLNSH